MHQRCALFIVSLLMGVALATGTDGIPVDFSFAGYGGGGEPLPSPRAVLRVKPSGGDDTAQLQAAIDQLATMPVAADGFRGALLFEPGEFLIAGQLQIRTGGIVLRGSPGNPGTTLKATGTGRRTLLEVQPAGLPVLASAVPVTDETVAVGALKITVAAPAEFKAGDRVVITRPCTDEWINSPTRGIGEPIGKAKREWWTRPRELHWTRTIAGIDPVIGQIVLDAPITTALERRFGGGTVARIVADPPLEKRALRICCWRARMIPPIRRTKPTPGLRFIWRMCRTPLCATSPPAILPVPRFMRVRVRAG